jgi:uncharacterized protein YjbJ (UPF0337 family)
MGFMDKLLGRSKKATGDMMGDSSMQKEGMHQEQQAMAEDRAESAEEMAQDERAKAAEHQAERDTP